MSDLIFTLTSGRSGSAWLAKFLEANLAFPVVHEPLSIDDFGNTMPDIRTMRAFNSRGMDEEVRGFWERKFSHIPLDKPYAETNHTLGKCGMIETLAESPLREQAKVIVLQRDLAKQTVSYIARHDFSNATLEWQWYLDPNYPNHITNAAPFLKMGISGRALWYSLEMACRQAYYMRQYADVIDFIPVQLEEAVKPEGARALLSALGHDAEPVLPPKANATRQPRNTALLAEINALLDQLHFDPEKLVSIFLDAGRSLDLSSLAKAA